MIVKSGSEYLVKSTTGRVLGKHDTKALALAQLKAIERDKAKRNVKKAWSGVNGI